MAASQTHDGGASVSNLSRAPSRHDPAGPVSADLPRPAASRLPRARWLDTRLVLGLLLVLLSVVLGAKVVTDADERVQVWSVTRDLGAGTPLGPDDVRVTAVRLDDAAAAYVSAAEDLTGVVLRRPVGRGELLPVTAVAPAGAREQRRMVIEVDRVGVAGLTKGRVVDVYVVREAVSGAEPGPPELVLAGATVAEDVRSSSGAFGGSSDRAGVTVLVDRADVPAVIDAVAHGSVYVVHVPPGAEPS
jgi:Flp pilus assembly protein CpaB